jgi:hypothetical protein
MKRSNGHVGIALIECINYKVGKYRIRFDFQPYEQGEIEGVSFLEEDILHKPTFAEVKRIVLDGYNAAIDEQILSAYVWKDMPIWLSSENQFNYKAAYDLAVMSEGRSLPVVFKVGTMDEPIYHRFTELSELNDFYIGAMNHINGCLQEGWAKKDTIDWDKYKETLNNLS